MNTKHTPGPWNISSANLYAVNARGRGIATAHGTDDVNYSDFFPPTEEAAANARLIAAAPELLEALQMFTASVHTCDYCDGSGTDESGNDTCHACHGFGLETSGDTLEAYHEARAAIAKVTNA